MFTTAAQLLDLTDSMAGLFFLVTYILIRADLGCILEKLVLVLRDGRKIIGVLRSWDQFGWHPKHSYYLIERLKQYPSQSCSYRVFRTDICARRFRGHS